METIVLREHADWIAVDKPAGLVVVPARREDPRSSLWRLLEAGRGERLWVVHRLDRGTSGVVLFARNAASHRALSLAFEHGAVHKTYLAVTRGLPPAAAGLIDTPLHRARRGKARPALPAEPGALPAATAYRLLESWLTPEGPVGLLELAPRTGRQHQIRVHLRSMGTPLLADPLYGGTGLRVALASPDRLTLHAARLEFPDPRTDEPVVVESPLAEDLRALVERLAQGAPLTG